MSRLFYHVNRHLDRLHLRHHITEESVLLVSVTKWLLFSTAIGVVVGATTAVFLRTLDWAIGAAAGTFVLLPVIFLLNSFLMRATFPEADAYSTDRVIKYVHKFQAIPILSGLKAFVGSILTIAAGGSAGKEAPAADIGASAGSALGHLLRLSPQDRRKLTICGISAGFAAVFGTPIAGAIFGMEVLFVGSVLYEVLLPCFVAGITAYGIAQMLGTPYWFHAVPIDPTFSEAFLLKAILAGIIFGVITFGFIESYRGVKKLVNPIPAPITALGGGLLLVILTLVFGTDYLGLGTTVIEGVLQGSNSLWYAFLLKMLFTVITLTMGGTGGIVTPLLFIGTTAGSMLGGMLGENPVVFGALGLVAVLAGATNAPIAASVLAIELFGPPIAPYAAVACILSFLMTGHRSVYPSQVLAMRKSQSLRTRLGSEMGESHRPFRVTVRRGSLLHVVRGTSRDVTKVARGAAKGVSWAARPVSEVMRRVPARRGSAPGRSPRSQRRPPSP